MQGDLTDLAMALAQLQAHPELDLVIRSNGGALSYGFKWRDMPQAEVRATSAKEAIQQALRARGMDANDTAQERGAEQNVALRNQMQQ